MQYIALEVLTLNFPFRSTPHRLFLRAISERISAIMKQLILQSNVTVQKLGKK